jgi:hypothetical protein
MLRRLIGLWCAGALLAGCGGGSHSTPPIPAANSGAAAGKKVAVTFSVSVPARSQSPLNRRLEYVSSATKSANIGVAAGSAVPTAADTVTVNCTTVCTGTVLAPIGIDTFVAKLFGALGGTGELLSTGTAKQTIAAGNAVRLSFNPVVASVALSLDKPALPADQPGTAQLNIIAKDALNQIIVGPGSYVDTSGQPLTIKIASSPLPNTKISPSPTEFSAPQTTAGASNTATVTFTPPGHFQFPTFTVANAGLPSDPPNGVTLLYEPLADDKNDLGVSGCIVPPSVGRVYFRYQKGIASVDPCNTLPGANQNPDIVQLGDTAITQTFTVTPHHNGVSLGFGSDKQVYYAYALTTTPAVIFGTLHARQPASRLLPLWTSRLLPLTQVSDLTLGNDGSLWFSGTATVDGSAVIGKVPPAGQVPAPAWVLIPRSKTVLSFAPGLGNTEVVLYLALDSSIHIATINSDLSGLASHDFAINGQINGQSPVGSDFFQVGLLAGTDGYVYVSVGDTMYRIRVPGGTISAWTDCQQHVTSDVFRLPDGTGVGIQDPGSFGIPTEFLHVVPGQGCKLVPAWNDGNPGQGNANNIESIDVTTDNWQFYWTINGHRRGIF